MTLQEWLLCATILLLLVLVTMVVRLRPRGFGRHLRRATVGDEPAISRGVLPMSSMGLHSPQCIEVFDEAHGTFRPVGLVTAKGEGDATDAAGDGIHFVRGKLYRITARPQRAAFRPERSIIGEGTSPDGAKDWNVHDFKIGNRSQFSQRGVIPGDMFATNAIDGFVSFETAQTAMDVSIDVSYIGALAAAPFMCSVVGVQAL